MMPKEPPPFFKYIAGMTDFHKCMVGCLDEQRAKSMPLPNSYQAPANQAQGANQQPNPSNGQPPSASPKPPQGSLLECQMEAK